MINTCMHLIAWSLLQFTELDLAIAKRAVQRANGRITLTSAPGRGTTVKLYLPVAAGDLDERAS